MCNLRVGHGYDVHRLVAGRKLILGGVHIPYDFGLDGHSDADVLVHAIIDSLLGAAALGNIGQHFPDTDASYKDIDSLLLLRKTAILLSENHYKILNIDSTVVAQAPKLNPYINKMREKISSALGIDISCVSVKAKTEEGLGFTGSGDGMTAYAIALIE